LPGKRVERSRRTAVRLESLTYITCSLRRRRNPGVDISLPACGRIGFAARPDFLLVKLGKNGLARHLHQSELPFGGLLARRSRFQDEQDFGIGPVDKRDDRPVDDSGVRVLIAVQRFGQWAQLDAPFDARLLVRGETALKQFDLRQPRRRLLGGRRRAFQPLQLESRFVRCPVDGAAVLDGDPLVRATPPRRSAASFPGFSIVRSPRWRRAPAAVIHSVDPRSAALSV
jgi:hypothetical protein